MEYVNEIMESITALCESYIRICEQCDVAREEALMSQQLLEFAKLFLKENGLIEKFERWMGEGYCSLRL